MALRATPGALRLVPHSISGGEGGAAGARVLRRHGSRRRWQAIVLQPGDFLLRNSILLARCALRLDAASRTNRSNPARADAQLLGHLPAGVTTKRP